MLIALAPPADASAEEQDDESIAPAARKGGKPAKREIPDYDGRGPHEPTSDESAIWIPRILLGPLYLTNEYIFRQPMWAIGTAAEKDHAPAKIARVMTLGTSNRAGFFPTAFFDFGFHPSFGVLLWANQGPNREAAFRLHFGFGGPQWWLVDVRQRFYIGKRQTRSEPFAKSQIYVRFLLSQRPDHIFYGFGPSPGEIQTRYMRRRIGGEVGSEIVFGNYDGVGFGFRVDNNEFGPGDPRSARAGVSIEEQFDVEDPAVVPGFDGYTLGTAYAVLNLDTRRPRPAGGTGLTVEVLGELGKDLARNDGLFLRYGGAIGLHLDLTRGRNRVLSLRQQVQLVQPLGADPGLVPFTELLSVGGSEVLRGHREGRYRGESMWSTSLQYSWPAWVVIDSLVFVEAANAFGHNLEGFAPQKLAMSFGIGLRTTSDRDSSFGVMVAAGTTTFDAPRFKLDSFRLVIGAGRGF